MPLDVRLPGNLKGNLGDNYSYGVNIRDTLIHVVLTCRIPMIDCLFAWRKSWELKFVKNIGD